MTSTFVVDDSHNEFDHPVCAVLRQSFLCVCVGVGVCVSVSHCISLYTLPKAQHNLLVTLQVTNPTPAHVLQ
jgi:hypothetical protein